MVQLSRPFQAVLAAVALFALVWFVALHRPGSTSTGAGSSAGSSSQSGGAPSASRASGHPASPSHSTTSSHTSKSSRSAASAHAKGAAAHVAAHPRASRTESHHRTTAGTGTAATYHGAAAQAGRSAARAQHAARGAHSTVHTGAATKHKALSTAHKAPSGRRARPVSEAAAVAAALGRGKTVMLLFWNPHASNDVSVHQQVGAVAHKLGRSVASFSARANQVGQFGAITRDVQVYQTPTLLIVNPKRQVTTVTGLTDAYALEQTIREARG